MAAIYETVRNYLSKIEFWDDIRDVDKAFCDKVFEPTEYNSLSDWRKRREKMVKKLKIGLGIYPKAPKTPLNKEIFDEIALDGFSIFKVRFEPLPGFFASGNLFVPKGAGPHPAILCPHGHWEAGRMVSNEENDVMLRCANFALMGYVVFAIDMIGYEDSWQLPHRFSVTAEDEAWSFGPMQLQTITSIRALDLLFELDYVDKEKIGCTGASGGATQSFILCAVDERVKVAAFASMVSFTMQGGCVCENAPSLRVDMNNPEIAAIFAPNPLLLTGSTTDWTVHLPNNEYPYLKRMYSLYGAEDCVDYIYVDAEHNYNKEQRHAAYNFFAKHLKANVDSWSEVDPNLGSYTRFKLNPQKPEPDSAEREKITKVFLSYQKEKSANMTERERAETIKELLGQDDKFDDGRFFVKIREVEQKEQLIYKYGSLRDNRYHTYLPFVTVENNASSSNKRLLIVAEDVEKAADLAQKAFCASIDAKSVIVPLLYPHFDKMGRKHQDLNHYKGFNRYGDVLRIQDIVAACRHFAGEFNQIYCVNTGVIAEAALCFVENAADLTILRDENEQERTLLIPGINTFGGVLALKDFSGKLV